MGKEYKIKRHQKIYRRNRSQRTTVVGVCVVVVVVAALVFLGWTLYEPVYNLITGKLSAPKADPSSQIAQEISSNEQSSPEQEGTAPVLPQNKIKGVYLPNTVLANQATLGTTLDGLKAQGINAIMFDLKDTNGLVLYNSTLDLVTQAKSLSPSAYDLDKTIALMKEKGMEPIGRICAFKDPVASANMPQSAVMYQGQSWMWLDNAKAAGGKTWLNPYSAVAQTYLTDLVSEVISRGVQTVVLTGVQFPEGFSLELASYGTESAGIAKTVCLRTFITKVEDTASALGGKAYTYIPADAALGVNNQMYGGDPLAMSNRNILFGAMPSLLGNTFTSDKLTLPTPSLTPGDTVEKLFTTLKPSLTGKNVLAMLQGYTADNLAAASNKTYTAAEIKEQIAAAEKAGIDQYILYNPKGQYPLS